MRRSVQPDRPSGLVNPDELRVESLGEATFPAPAPHRELFVEEDDAVLMHGDALELAPYLAAWLPPPAFEPAGPRAKSFYDPANTTAAIVTCGGLCPGVNDVIRSIFLTLKFRYGVPRLLGVRYGYNGLASHSSHPPIELTMDSVRRIHEQGGSILASSRGAPPVPEMVDTLVRLGVNMLFTIGGDGTLRGAEALAREIARRELPIAIVGVPKTIDNDVHWVERTFGFATAVEEASRAIMGAHVEAKGAFNGVGLVKLMGRHAGFIAAHASLANSDVNFCLVPEEPLVLDGPNGFLSVLDARLARSHHAVIVVAEGAGQQMMDALAPPGTDPSGNLRLHDIGVYLRDRLVEHCRALELPLTLKYIDPSYIVRSLPANAFDSALCLMLGQHAVHAAMAGRTSVVVGYWNQRFTHVPISLATKHQKKLDPRGELWQAVLGATGQPSHWT